MPGRAVFLDKDGTLVENVPYNVALDRVRLVDGARQALAEMRSAGYELIVASNQSGVVRGLCSEQDVRRVARYLGSLLATAGTPLGGFYFCPHLRCAGRKPAPGMLHQAAIDHRLDLRSCWFVGDILDDVEAGSRAGCRTILVDNGGETEWRRGPFREPAAVVPDLRAAARVIACS
ncbi:MAG: HAD family hydrolase [Chloroflexi bacterium]|nr:HAD family hydrolase [Chloroflexota bacterium]